MSNPTFPQLTNLDLPPVLSSTFNVPTKKGARVGNVGDLRTCATTLETNKCPLPLFFALLIIGYLLVIFFIWLMKELDDAGVAHSKQQKLLATVVATFVYMLIGGFFLWWLTFSCNECSGAAPFTILGIAIFGPVNTFLFTSFILTHVMNVDSLY